MRATPRYLSPIPEGTDIEAAHIGARLQRLPITPQGELVAGVLEARKPNGMPLYKQFVTEIPRRSTKTTTIQNVLLGRCASRPGYQVVSTAQDGTRASQFFRDMMDLIEAHANEIMEARNDERAEAYEGDGEPEEFTFKDALKELGIRQLYYSQQREYIKWRNGSKWRVAKPEPSGLRGGAAHTIWFDEAGELDAEGSPALLAGALPMMDTKPEAQIIISGTPGLVRAGMFWQTLEKARERPDRFGIVDYCAKDSEVISEEQAANEDLWWEVHPGLACGLTSIETIRERFEDMGVVEFVREYLCVWPPDTSTSALDREAWAAAAVGQLENPDGLPWALGYDVAIGSSAAALAAAWFDAEGHPHVQLLDHRAGSHWLGDELLKATMKHPRISVGYDNIGDNIAVAQALARRPRFQTKALKSLQLREVAASTATLVGHLEQGTFTHAADNALDAAVQNVVWRDASGSRLFGRKHGRDISPLLACVHALAAASTAKAQTRVRLPEVLVG